MDSILSGLSATTIRMSPEEQYNITQHGVMIIVRMCDACSSPAVTHV